MIKLHCGIPERANTTNGFACRRAWNRPSDQEGIANRIISGAQGTTAQGLAALRVDNSVFAPS